MADISKDKLRKKVKEILKGADLSTLSAKKVRIKLQSAFDTDLSERKKEIDKMTMSLIMEIESEKGKKEESESEKEEEVEEEEQSKNGNSKTDSSDSEDVEVEDEPPKKKSKTKEKSEKKKKSKKERDMDDPENDSIMNIYDEEQKVLKLTDEELAHRLQSFEETGRRTRNRAAAPKKKVERKQSEKKKGTSTYSRPCLLSADLAGIMGVERLARNEVVKKMWEIVKERKLEDPKDRRFMLCDEQLLKVFGKKRVQTFGMMKYLATHIRDESSSLESVITNSDIYDDEADDD